MIKQKVIISGWAIKFIDIKESIKNVCTKKIIGCFCQVRNYFDSNIEPDVNKTIIFVYLSYTLVTLVILFLMQEWCNIFFQWSKKSKNKNKNENLEALNRLQW